MNTKDGDQLGRYVYRTAPLASSPDFFRYTTYQARRLSDERFLGLVQREVGKSWWFSRTPDGQWTTHGVRTRDEAADWLDGESLLNEWCACGTSVGEHDRATRAACHAWAVSSAVDPIRADSAWSAAYQRRPRGRHFDVSKAVTHARTFATPPPPGTTRLVKTVGDDIVRVDLHLDSRTGYPVADTWASGAIEFAGTFGDPDDQLQDAIDRHLHDGWYLTYDWRR